MSMISHNTILNLKCPLIWLFLLLSKMYLKLIHKTIWSCRDRREARARPINTKVALKAKKSVRWVWKGETRSAKTGGVVFKNTGWIGPLWWDWEGRSGTGKA